MDKPSEFFLPFVKKEHVAKDIFSFYFDRTQSYFNFIPGQYIRMVLPHENPDERGTSRFFTVASSPLERNYLRITTRVIRSSFKHTLANLLRGTPVQFYGPMGNFVLHDDEINPLVFLAGGIGLTPYHSMITYAAAKNLHIPITMFVSFSKPEEMVFYKELTAITDRYTNIKVIYSLSHSQEYENNWNGETGRITGSLIKRYVTYIVGPSAMTDAMRELVSSFDIDEEQVILETFTGY